MYHIDSGYSMSLEDLADRYCETEEDDFDADKEAKKIIEPVSKRGDVYQLGDHRIMCGDATSLDDLRVLTGGGKMSDGIHRSAIQRGLFGSRKENIKQDSQRQNGGFRLPHIPYGRIRELSGRH